MVFKSCLATWAEPDRGIVGLRELEFLGVGGLPVMNALEPLVKAGPFEHFQMAFVTIPVNNTESSVRHDLSICVYNMYDGNTNASRLKFQ